MPAAIAQNGERFLAAEHDRLMGELLLLPSVKHSEAEAKGWFQQSLMVARQQRAKSFELRVASSLARLWIAQKNEHQTSVPTAAFVRKRSTSRIGGTPKRRL